MFFPFSKTLFLAFDLVFRPAASTSSLRPDTAPAPLMELQLPGCRIRSWRAGDEPALARHADSRKIWLNVRDRFPHPYTLADAECVGGATCAAAEPETQFAVEVDGEAAGGVGLFLQEDVARYTRRDRVLAG